MIEIGYQDSDRRAFLKWSSDLDGTKIISLITRLIADNCEEYAQEGMHRISLPWWSFISIRSTVFAFFDT